MGKEETRLWQDDHNHNRHLVAQHVVNKARTD